MLPRNRYSMLDKHKHEKQKNFVNNKKPAIDSTEQPHDRLHDADPQKVVYLVATDRTHRNTQPTQRAAHETKPASSPGILHNSDPRK